MNDSGEFFIAEPPAFPLCYFPFASLIANIEMSCSYPSVIPTLCE